MEVFLQTILLLWPPLDDLWGKKTFVFSSIEIYFQFPAIHRQFGINKIKEITWLIVKKKVIGFQNKTRQKVKIECKAEKSHRITSKEH